MFERKVLPPFQGRSDRDFYSHRHQNLRPHSLKTIYRQTHVSMHAIQTKDVSKADKHFVSANILGHRTHITIVIAFPNYLHDLFNHIFLCVEGRVTFQNDVLSSMLHCITDSEYYVFRTGGCSSTNCKSLATPSGSNILPRNFLLLSTPPYAFMA
jgi:hypothetical protein